MFIQSDLWRMSPDKRLTYSLLFPLVVPFKIVLQKGLTVDFEKSPVLACLVLLQEKHNNASGLAHLLVVAPFPGR